MCGNAGFFDAGGRCASPEAVLKRMTRALIHRGPDAEGFWFDAGVGVVLIEQLGVAEAVKQFVGMFAFALWDVLMFQAWLDYARKASP